jgi:acyl-CoA thioester hydrolase
MNFNTGPTNRPRFSAPFELHYRVVASDIDAMNHVNNLEYLRWTLKAAHAHSRSVGWPSERFKELGAGFIVRSHQIKYRLPALLGDAITIKTWIQNLQKFSSIRKYYILRTADGKRLADVETNWVFVDFKTTQLRPIPNAIGKAFSR